MKGGGRKGTGKNWRGRKAGRVQVFCWKSGLWPRLIANKCCGVSTLKTLSLSLCDGKKVFLLTHTHTHRGTHVSKLLSLYVSSSQVAPSNLSSLCVGITAGVIPALRHSHIRPSGWRSSFAGRLDTLHFSSFVSFFFLPLLHLLFLSH